MAASKSGMDVKTARKYAKARKLPAELQREHTWRSQPDAFAEVWDEVKGKLAVNAGLQRGGSLRVALMGMTIKGLNRGANSSHLTARQLYDLIR